MFWLFSEPLPEIENAVAAAGHGVLSTSETWASLYPLDDPTFYPLDRLVRQHGPDVLVLVDPLRHPEIEGRRVQFGYTLDAVRRWAKHRKVIVIVERGDPSHYEAFQGRQVRGCVARPRHGQVYVTNDEATRAQAARTMRAVRWVPGCDVGPLLAHVEDVRAARRYRPG